MSRDWLRPFRPLPRHAKPAIFGGIETMLLLHVHSDAQRNTACAIRHRRCRNWPGGSCCDSLLRAISISNTACVAAILQTQAAMNCGEILGLLVVLRQQLAPLGQGQVRLNCSDRHLPRPRFQEVPIVDELLCLFLELLLVNFRVSPRVAAFAQEVHPPLSNYRCPFVDFAAVAERIVYILARVLLPVARQAKKLSCRWSALVTQTHAASAASRCCRASLHYCHEGLPGSGVMAQVANRTARRRRSSHATLLAQCAQAARMDAAPTHATGLLLLRLQHPALQRATARAAGEGT